MSTTGEEAHGVWGQSVGGGGGIGGYTYAAGLNLAGASANGSNTVTVSVGGQGGAGSNGNTVDVTNTGTVNTSGAKASGVRAQSIGGGGGDGGAVISGFLNGASGNSQSLTVLIGGSGGDGGTGGVVSALNEGIIGTTGEQAPGIWAQSIGGSGGNGGVILAASIAVQGSNMNLGVTIGGGGGSGGTSGDVSVINRPGVGAGTGQITTLGTESYGVFAQSIGGGGGNGSSIITANFASGGSGSALAAGLTIGGAGGTGNNAGNVTVLNAGLIDTTGDRAHGIFAQSIGGGGGNGGLVISANATIGQIGASPLLALGGFGGAGGDGGDVTVTNTGTIITRGANAHGILAQSISGGGGNAGVGLTLTPNIANIVIANAISAIVGALAGGATGTTGDVTVNQNGNIIVLGDGSVAVMAEAVSGGGGSLAFSFEGITSLPGLIPAAASAAPLTAGPSALIAIAGFVTIEDIAANPFGTVVSMTIGSDAGLTGQSGANMFSTSAGDFVTLGNASPGIALLSVGGGGGSAFNSFAFAPIDVLNDFFGYDARLGGANGLNNGGGAVTATHVGNLITVGAISPAVQLQSVGGGGGNTSVLVDGRSASFGAARFNLGATDSSGETGGAVSYDQTGDIMTLGDASPGILMQSIGGGGGVASFADLAADAQARNASISIALGASGGTGNDGGIVSSTLIGSIATSGVNASAVVLQSIGGGGGAVLLADVEYVWATLGGSDGAEGDGGAVSYTQTGDITTTGDRAHGIFAQSIGGGGGAVFTDIAAPEVTFSGANTGNGGALTLQNTGDIYTTGAESVGVFAQSLGGGGGFVDGGPAGTAGGAGAGGAVSFLGTGNIIADGADGIAVFAQSVGASGGGNIDVSVDGVIKGGSGDPASVSAFFLDGGASNTVTLGQDSFVFALSDRAFTATGGDDAVTSNGFVIGNIDLDGGTNSFLNTASGTLRTLDIVDLGPNGLLTNAGLLVPGGFVRNPETPLGTPVGAADFIIANNRPQTTAVTGSIDLTASSTFLVDAAFLVSGMAGGMDSDLITATGFGAIDGTVTPTLLRLERALPLVIIDPVTSSADNGAQATDTIVIDYSIGLDGPTGDGTTIDLLMEPDFSIEGMNRNQTALGDHINDILLGDGSAALGDLFAFIGNQTEVGPVIDAIDRLSPEGYASLRVDAFLGADRFADAMLDCEALTPDETGLPEGVCVWMQVEGRFFQRDPGFQFKDIDSRSFRVAGGFETAIDANWRFGFAGGYERVNLTYGNRFDSTAKRGHLGAVVRYEDGPLDLGIGVSASHGSTENERFIGIEGLIAEDRPLSIGQAKVDQRLTTANIRLHGSYDLPVADPRFYATPSVDLNASYIRSHDATEKGVGPYGADLKSNGEWVLSATAGIEVGGRFEVDESIELGPFMRVGVTAHTKDELSIRSMLIGAPASAGNFRSAVGFDQVVGEVAVGLAVSDQEHGVSLRIGYDGAFGSRSTQHAGFIKFAIEF